MDFDFIIIGGGLAGLTSTLVLEKYGKVLLISKNKLADCATSFAQGGIAAVVSGADSFASHIKDTLIAGSNHNKRIAVEFLVKNSPKAIRFLEEQGVVFDTKNGSFNLGREGGHKLARVVHASDFTGKAVENTLIKRVKEKKNILIWENCFVLDLLVSQNRCFGVELIKSSGHEIINCFSRATILATGGLGQAYEWTTNPEIATGDGIGMAYRAGADITDLEFIQFHPTALKDGKSPLFLISEALRGEGAMLVKTKNKEQRTKNRNTEKFMMNYDKRLELAPRDIVSKAIYYEQEKGYGVYLDIRHKGKKFLVDRFPNIYKELKKRGYDLAKDLIPVTPAAHYSCGGVRVDIYGRTSVDGLFAFGEVSRTGVHGANRLASNSLLEAVGFPLHLKEFMKNKKIVIHFNDINHSSKNYFHGLIDESINTNSFPLNFRRIKKDIQRLMWEKVGIVRTRKGLKEALMRLEEWEKKLNRIKNMNIELAETKNMVLAAKLITKSALNRTKSLGSHYVAA